MDAERRISTASGQAFGGGGESFGEHRRGVPQRKMSLSKAQLNQGGAVRARGRTQQHRSQIPLPFCRIGKGQYKMNQSYFKRMQVTLPSLKKLLRELFFPGNSGIIGMYFLIE